MFTGAQASAPSTERPELVVGAAFAATAAGLSAGLLRDEKPAEHAVGEEVPEAA